MNSVNLGSGVHFFQEYGADNFIIEKPHMPFHLGGRVEAIRLVKAILAALGEPVEEPVADDGGFRQWLLYLQDDKTTDTFTPNSADLSTALEFAKAASDGPVGVYELRGWVDREPDPTERKVARL